MHFAIFVVVRILASCESKNHVLIVRTNASCDLRCRAKYSVVRNTDIDCRAKYGVVRVVRKNSTCIPPGTAKPRVMVLGTFATRVRILEHSTSKAKLFRNC